MPSAATSTVLAVWADRAKNFEIFTLLLRYELKVREVRRIAWEENQARREFGNTSKSFISIPIQPCGRWPAATCGGSRHFPDRLPASSRRSGGELMRQWHKRESRS